MSLLKSLYEIMCDSLEAARLVRLGELERAKRLMSK